MNRRSKSRFPGLEKQFNLKIRHELMDADYIDKLNDTEKLMAI